MRWLLLATLVLAACSSDPEIGDASPDAGAGDQGVADLGAATDAGDTDAGVSDLGPGDAGSPDLGTLDAEAPDLGSADAGPLTLSSTAFMMNGAIPDRHSCNGVDLQPELSWTPVPSGTLSLALVLIDDSINFVHWIAYDLPPGLTGLAEGASDGMTLPTGAVEADAYCIQFCGPCPGSMHTYSFRLYALDVATINYNWPGTIRATHLAAAFDSHTLARADLTGTYTP